MLKQMSKCHATMPLVFARHPKTADFQLSCHAIASYLSTNSRPPPPMQQRASSAHIHANSLQMQYLHATTKLSCLEQTAVRSLYSCNSLEHICLQLQRLRFNAYGSAMLTSCIQALSVYLYLSLSLLTCPLLITYVLGGMYSMQNCVKDLLTRSYFAIRFTFVDYQLLSALFWFYFLNSC